MTTVHVFIAASVDGYIARADGDIDWLLQRDAAGEDHGYDHFIADKDLVVMGRGCYEKVLTFGAWPYALPVCVLSRQLASTAVPEHLPSNVRFSAASPRELLTELARQPVNRIYLDGGQLVQSFLREDLVDELIITTVPVLLGGGRPLFGALPHDIQLQLTATRQFASGLVQNRYVVSRQTRQ